MDILQRLATWRSDSVEEREMLEACEDEIGKLRDLLESIARIAQPHNAADAVDVIGAKAREAIARWRTV